MLGAVDDRDRRAPVALARDQPIPQTEVDRRAAAPLGPQPVDDRGERGPRGQAPHQTMTGALAAGEGSRSNGREFAMTLSPAIASVSSSPPTDGASGGWIT